MRFTIISINDDRLRQKEAIRQHVQLEEIFVECVNGNDDEQLFGANAKWNFKKHCGLQRGEWGIWFSTVNCWNYAAQNGDLILFEDDAIVDHTFMEKFNKYLNEIPADADFVALWVPDNQRQDYLYNVEFDELGKPRTITGSLEPHNSLFNVDHEYLAKAYQGYGGVAFLITQRGGRKLLELLEREGYWSTSDCFYFLECHRNNLNGYALKPQYCDMIQYDWSTPTQVHITEFLDLTKERNE